MSEQNSTGWPFGQAAGEGLDISAIFGTGTADPNRNPFDPTGAASAPAASVTPPPAAPVTPSPAAPVTPPPAAPVMPPPAAPVTQPPAAPVTQPPAAPVAQSPAAPIAPPPAAPVTQSPVEAEQPANPIEAAFAKQEMANAQQNLLEKKPIFCHKGAKEPIEDPTITFEELRICKAEDFVDLEEGKTVSWSMEYGGIRKEVKDPKGTTIAAMKQSIERSREFLEALKKSKDKNPDCLVRPKVIMKTKGILSPYKAHCESLEEARKSDKVICLVPSGDGKLYEVRKLEQGEFIAPAKKASEFQVVKAGFTPALPLIPMALIGQITAFFRSFMRENEENEALALIYWDKVEQRFFAYVPPQVVSTGDIEADLRDCPYQWGIGRVLYDMNTVWVDIEKKGKTWFIRDDQRQKLDNAYLKLLDRLGLKPMPAGGTEALLVPKDIPEPEEDGAPPDAPGSVQSAPVPEQKPGAACSTQPAAPSAAPKGSTAKAEQAQVSSAAGSRSRTASSAPSQNTYEYRVAASKVQKGMNTVNTLVRLEAADGKQVDAFAPGEHHALTVGTLLTGVRLSVRRQDTVVFYVLEDYRIATAPQAA